MEEPLKETVIIVHGTWAAPDPAKRRWYQPADGVPAAEGFVSKLDAALQKRGSPARCWAHCTKGNPIFRWSGENSWIARTRAASALGDYVAKLRTEGWLCHIVAHSHGGNVVVEALPQIITAPDSDESHGKLVTLGAPFMDTISPILKRAKRGANIVNLASLTSFSIVMLTLIYFIQTQIEAAKGVAQYFSSWLNIITLLATLFIGVLFFVRRRRRTRPNDVFATLKGTSKPPLLAIGSPTAEAWQILHHMRTISNPLAVSSNLPSYLFVHAILHVTERAGRSDTWR